MSYYACCSSRYVVTVKRRYKRRCPDMRIVLLVVELRYEISVYLRRYGLLTASVKTMLNPRRET